MVMDDLNIYYIGGSGGFYLMHQLLITEQYWCSFGLDHIHTSFDIIRKSTFDQNRVSWKSNEIWPDNQLTLTSTTSVSKIYLFNNMWGFSSWEKYPGKKLALYTDEKSWLRITANKGAALYWNRPRDDYFSITRSALRTNAYCRYISTSHQQAASYCFDWKDMITPRGIISIFDTLGLEFKDTNWQFMKFYLKQHDISLLHRVLGYRIDEVSTILNS